MKPKYGKEFSPAIEDFLRAIYQLSEEHDAGTLHVTTSSIASRLNVRPASVTAMTQKMAAVAPPLVDYHKSFGVRLTTVGHLAALRIVRCHRLLEAFLHAKLGYGWDEVHDEADRLEHAVSAEMVDRLADALGNPNRDPHGHAIPAADLSLKSAPVARLADVPAGGTATVEYVLDDDAELLRRLDSVGVFPGRRVEVIDVNSPADLLVIVGDSRQPSRLEADVAAVVFVSTTGGSPFDN